MKKPVIFFLRGLSFSCCRWMFIEVLQFQENSPALKISWLRAWNSSIYSSTIYHSLRMTLCLSITKVLQIAVKYPRLYRQTLNENNRVTTLSLKPPKSLLHLPSTLHKKWSFPWRISSVNVTKSAGYCGFGHIYYWRNS